MQIQLKAMVVDRARGDNEKPSSAVVRRGGRQRVLFLRHRQGGVEGLQGTFYFFSNI